MNSNRGRRSQREGAREGLSLRRQDAYFTGWVFASMFTTAALCEVFGLAGLGVAVAIAVLLAVCWFRRVAARVWWYCWIVLMLVGIGLAVYDAHTPRAPLPPLTLHNHFPLMDVSFVVA